ncbi:hypothetical protein JL722_5119 [Aureococcus anophagefferens]|nr:hypothetical protein JL722_5119 [Aureococcus anophagefferens]
MAAAVTRVTVTYESPGQPYFTRFTVDPGDSGRRHTVGELLNSFCVQHRKKYGAASDLVSNPAPAPCLEPPRRRAVKVFALLAATARPGDQRRRRRAAAFEVCRPLKQIDRLDGVLVSYDAADHALARDCAQLLAALAARSRRASSGLPGLRRRAASATSRSSPALAAEGRGRESWALLGSCGDVWQDCRAGCYRDAAERRADQRATLFSADRCARAADGPASPRSVAKLAAAGALREGNDPTSSTMMVRVDALAAFARTGAVLQTETGLQTYLARSCYRQRFAPLAPFARCWLVHMDGDRGDLDAPADDGGRLEAELKRRFPELAGAALSAVLADRHRTVDVYLAAHAGAPCAVRADTFLSLAGALVREKFRGQPPRLPADRNVALVNFLAKDAVFGLLDRAKDAGIELGGAAEP